MVGTQLNNVALAECICLDHTAPEVQLVFLCRLNPNGRHSRLLHRLAALCPDLTHLHITQGMGLSCHMLQDVRFHKLESLCLAGCSKVMCVPDLFCSSLQHIDLSDTSLTDFNLKIMVSDSP